MPEIDYVTERQRLLEELRHHHTAPSYVALDDPGTDRARWRVGAPKADGCPETWAGVPVRYVDAPEVPRSSTRDWLRSSNALKRPKPGS
jgi:hypothetical protein